MKKKILLTLLFCFVFIFTACGSPATKSNSSKKLNEIDTQKNENKDENISENKIVWVLPEEFIKITKLQDNTVYLNQQLKKDGYKFSVAFKGVSGTGDDYYKDVMKEMKNNTADIASLGLDAKGEKVEPSVKLIKSGVFLNLNNYLKSAEGKKLHSAFHDKIWDTVKINGEICAIPSQTSQDGTAFAAFNKKIFGKNIAFDGSSMQELDGILNKVKLPKGTNGILWQLAFRDICEQLGYVYENGVVTDIKTGVVSCPFETSEIVEYLKLLHKLYQEKKLVALDDGENSQISNMKFAVWMGYTRDEVFERVKDNTKIVQLPYLFFTRTSGSTGVNKISKKKNEAIQLLSLLYTDSKYANLLIHGKKGKTYQLKNGYAYDMEGNVKSEYAETFITGIYDYIYPWEEEEFPRNRAKEKQSLLGTPAMQKSTLMGFVPDLTDFDDKMIGLYEVTSKYEEIWQKKDFDSALADAVKACNASESKKVERELNSQISKWRSK